MLTSILTSVVGVIIGGLITWFFAWRYYKKAGQELLDESSKLARLHEITLNALEDAGMVRLNRGQGLRILGREIHARDLDKERGTVLGPGDLVVDTMEEAMREGRAVRAEDITRPEPSER